MKGWAIFRRSILWLADYLPAALRISVVPYAVMAGLDFWIRATWPDAAFAPGVAMPEGFAMATIISLVVTLVVTIWVAIAWHRFLILGELQGGWLPPTNQPVLGPYIAKLMGIGLFAMAAILISGIVAAPFAVAYGPESVMVVSQGLGAVLATFLVLRFGLVLPAAASGQPLEFGEAWDAAEGRMLDIAVLVACTLALSAGLTFAVQLDGGPSAITPLYSVVTGWINLMLGTTVLTALYVDLRGGPSHD